MSATQVLPTKVLDTDIIASVNKLVKESHVYDVALFLASPFIGLAYAVALPFVGTAMIFYVGWKALKGEKS